MNERVRKLREQSLNAINRLSHERSVLVTDYYQNQNTPGLSKPVERANLFEHILKNKYICINDFELIVGERGPAPKATPTYPEITLHSLKDLDILDSRPKVSFKVNEKTRKIYKEQIIPFWKGNTNRDRIMQNMDN
ncbi:MAG: formate C-acetyltransferase/glycerol dehydratase family glycyl radical enzyme, partial [Bacteroidales bacterium]|nr:formate C-acetyltransferase/glycerol dehydratase family glycyl radical enzyme [Bacteroidales bacterium]